jgi:hypothetical protein
LGLIEAWKFWYPVMQYYSHLSESFERCSKGEVEVKFTYYMSGTREQVANAPVAWAHRVIMGGERHRCVCPPSLLGVLVLESSDQRGWPSLYQIRRHLWDLQWKLKISRWSFLFIYLSKTCKWNGFWRSVQLIMSSVQDKHAY